MRRSTPRAALWVTVVASVAALASCSGSGSDTARRPTDVTPPHSDATSTPRTSPPAPGPSTTSGGATSGASPTISGGATITMVMSGDVLLHEGLWATAQDDAARTGRGALDFRPLLADLRPVISGADLAICHMETPLAPAGGPYYGYPTFSVPPEIVPALKWEGYDACSTASNHSIDQGFEGLRRTIDDFDRAGLAHFGTVKTKAESGRPVIVEVKGVKVGLVTATYGTNGIPLPADEPWSVPVIDPHRIIAMAHLARLQGASIVLVALHWGLEYQNEPSSDQTAVAEALTKSPDISFVYGEHAHVVQPYDLVNGTWVAYGLGNAVARQETSVTGVYDGNTCRVTFTQGPDGSYGVSKLEYLPTMITKYDDADPTAHPMRWLDVPKDLTDPAYAALHSDLVATEARVRANVNLLGALQHGVTEAH